MKNRKILRFGKMVGVCGCCAGVFNMMTKGSEYVKVGMKYYEEKYKKRIIKNLKKKAKTLGMTLVTME